jgi:hypothetical protein
MSNLAYPSALLTLQDWYLAADYSWAEARGEVVRFSPGKTKLMKVFHQERIGGPGWMQPRTTMRRAGLSGPGLGEPKFKDTFRAHDAVWRLGILERLKGRGLVRLATLPRLIQV